VSEGGLDGDLPACSIQPPGSGSYKASVTLVEQTVELAASPADVRHEAGIYDGKDPFHGAERQTIPMSALDQRDRALVYAGQRSDIDLPQSFPEPQRTEGEADTHSIHRRIMS
jgi:hypothetical protein